MSPALLKCLFVDNFPIVINWKKIFVVLWREDSFVHFFPAIRHKSYIYATAMKTFQFGLLLPLYL